MASTSTDQDKKNNDTSHFAKPLLVGAASAFGAGLFGAIWHTKRKQAKYEQQEAVLLQQQQQQQQQQQPHTTQPSPAGSSASASPHKSSASASSSLAQPMQPKGGAGAMPPHQPYVPPSMSPAEFELAKKDARFFAIKSLGYGTLLALTGAGVLATVVGYCLDVRNFREFSDKLHVIIPQRTARLRRYLGGKELEMTQAEEEELDALAQETE
ncbi:hypothetical protein BCR42DRAFT_455863 [Absidia repens]|uniref:Uncharacterized protein n=1 Tax=Absidia repens TaxID=90262 RepID=A0A1X2I2L4_9FUNG|nr:hypothetical protein BCR42DRAFT_455863 [Absidia repens]